MGPAAPRLGAPLSGPTTESAGHGGPDRPPADQPPLPFRFICSLIQSAARVPTSRQALGTEQQNRGPAQAGSQPAGGDRQRKHTDERQELGDGVSRGRQAEGSLTPTRQGRPQGPRLPSLSSGRGRSSRLMRNAGTRCNEMHVSPQAQTEGSRGRGSESDSGAGRGSRSHRWRLRAGGGALGVNARGGGLVSSTGQGDGGAGGTSGGLGTHTALHFRRLGTQPVRDKKELNKIFKA